MYIIRNNNFIDNDHACVYIIQLHSWVRFVGILLSVSGAIEVALTGDDQSSSLNPGNESNTTVPSESTSPLVSMYGEYWPNSPDV